MYLPVHIGDFDRPTDRQTDQPTNPQTDIRIHKEVTLAIKCADIITASESPLFDIIIVRVPAKIPTTQNVHAITNQNQSYYKHNHIAMRKNHILCRENHTLGGQISDLAGWPIRSAYYSGKTSRS